MPKLSLTFGQGIHNSRLFQILSELLAFRIGHLRWWKQVKINTRFHFHQNVSRHINFILQTLYCDVIFPGPKDLERLQKRLKNWNENSVATRNTINSLYPEVDYGNTHTQWFPCSPLTFSDFNPTIPRTVRDRGVKPGDEAIDKFQTCTWWVLKYWDMHLPLKQASLLNFSVVQNLDISRQNLFFQSWPCIPR